MPPLSPYRLHKARDIYNLFNMFNSLSWQFLVGNVVTLLALRLGASSTYIGLLNAILYVSFFFLPLGKILARRFSIIGIFSAAWIIRAVGMAPALAAPFAAYAGRTGLALALLVIGITIFHITRGVGMIGNNPVLSYLASGPDRGAYMTQIQIINNAVGMFAGFVIALILGRDPPLFLYTIILGIGVVTGIGSGVFMRKVPEPDPDAPAGAPGPRFADILRVALNDPNLRRFIVILLLVALVSGVSRAFLVVYAREIFRQSDGMVSLFAVSGGLGVLMIGLMVKFLVDRIGAKPIFILCMLTGLVSLVPVVAVPRPGFPGPGDTSAIFYLTFLFFLMNFGFLGAEGIAQTYFLGLIPQNLMMDMGILYFLCFGLAGTGGSFLAGVFLDGVAALGLAPSDAFRLLYLLLTALAVLTLALQRRMAPLGALPFKGALEVIFSFRDLRAISLLDRLDKTGDAEEEEALLDALHDAPSNLAAHDLLARARSPRLAVRLEALRAMDALETLDAGVVTALTDDLVNHPYTTAYVSARILGKHGVFSAAPLLRELAGSGDYMLAGESMIALARLGDHAFRPEIERVVADTVNPRLKIMGVQAFGIYGSPNSLSVLLDILRGADPPPYLRDEVILAMAAILGVQNRFYHVLVRFLEEPALAPALALDEAESACERALRRKRSTTLAAPFQAAVTALSRGADPAPLARWILTLPDALAGTVVRVVLAEALLDDELSALPRLRLLITHWAADRLTAAA